MEEALYILPPVDEDDTEGAQRIFEEFLVMYEPTLVSIEYYLEHVIEEAGPEYAEAYRPWHGALQELFRGVYLTVKKIPLPDPESFLDAVRTFSFGSSIRFLRDICVSCRVPLSRNWSEQFHEHINLLLFAASILKRHQQQSLAR